MTKKAPTILQSAIPLNRGIARHIETPNKNLAATLFIKGKVEQIVTPKEPIKRIHEVLHARHSNPEIQYRGIRQEVRDLVEDCRIHLKFWPWMTKTPRAIRESAYRVLQEEINGIDNLKKEKEINPVMVNYAEFATKLRANSVWNRITRTDLFASYKDDDHHQFANQMHSLICKNGHEEAARQIQAAFFGDDGNDGQEESIVKEEGEEETDGKTNKKVDVISAHKSHMKIINLPLTEQTSHLERGFRVANMGSRLYRPALRRPILPTRLFIRTSPQEAGGVILFDASGSMDVNPIILADCCRRAPFATVAYYCGDDIKHGWLHIFAKDGMRAVETPIPDGGNTVDGLAMDWMLAQEGPYILVTDRGFCGSSDSIFQKIRLQRLEVEGTVCVYETYSEFLKEYPMISQ